MSHRPNRFSAHDVIFPEATAAGHTCPPEPEDNESELTSTTTLDISDDEMSTDGESLVETKEEQPPREPMRSEGYRFILNVASGGDVLRRNLTCSCCHMLPTHTPKHTLIFSLSITVVVSELLAHTATWSHSGVIVTLQPTALLVKRKKKSNLE